MLNQQEKTQILKAIELNPVWGIEKLFQCKLWEKQKEIAESVLLHKNKKTAVRSCHDSGKSFDAARIVLTYLMINPDSLVITTAPSWTQVREILWREIRGAYKKMEEIEPLFGVGGKLLETKLEFSENWFAIGLATRKEGEASEVAERMLGFHSPTGKILIVVDEGSGVEEPIWGAIDGLLTSEKAQLLALGNPYRKTGSFAKLFTSRGVYKIHIQDTDIPNIKKNRVVIPGLMSPTYPREMEEKYGKDSNLYLIKVKGEFPKTETDTLISVDDIENAFLREVHPTGKKKLGVDVARFGHNFTVLVVRQGFKVLKKEKYSKESTMQTVSRVLRVMETENIKPEQVFIDDIGVGGGVVDRLHEKEKMVNGVNVGAEAEDSDHYANIRAECYWAIKSWIKKADLPNDEDFFQLANIKYKWKSEKSGQLKIESKEEMSKRGLESPDVADALMLTFTGAAPSPFPEPEKPIEEVGPWDEESKGGRPETSEILRKEF